MYIHKKKDFWQSLENDLKEVFARYEIDDAIVRVYNGIAYVDAAMDLKGNCLHVDEQ